MNSPVRYCTICRSPVSLKRIMRASPYCSDECRLRAKNEMRDVRAQCTCRLCGRPLRTRIKSDTTKIAVLPVNRPNHRKPSNRLEDSEVTSDANGALKEFGADGKGEVGTV